MIIRNEMGEFAKTMKWRYPSGSRVECDFCEDPWAPIYPGERGTVVFVDDIGTVHIKWDNGRSLGLVYPEDKFHIVAEED